MSTLIELQVHTKQRGFAVFEDIQRKSNVKKLNVEYTGDGRKTTTAILENVTSGDTLRFRSLYEASRVLHMNPGSISYAIRANKQIVILECGFIPAGEYILYEEKQVVTVE